MRILAWLRQRGLERRKKEHACRLAEIRTSLRKIKTREPRTRYAIKLQLVRIQELNKQLKRVKTGDELKFWYSLFTMCIPSFKALIGTPRTETKRRL